MGTGSVASRTVVIVILLLAGTALAVISRSSTSAIASRPLVPSAKKVCHYKTKKVHGKKKRVRVCKIVAPKPTATPSPTPTSTPPTLKGVADQRGIDVAVTVSDNWTNWSQFATTVANNFNTVNIVDTDMKSSTSAPDFRPDPTTYRFDLIDPQVQFARDHGMKIYMHIFEGIDGVPDWLKNGNYTPDQLRQIIADEVNQVMGRYKGEVANYTVVTEPLPEGWKPANGLDDPFSESLGDSYLDYAFKAARLADPTATPTLNQLGTMDPTSPDFQWLLATVQRLRSESVVVNGKTYPLIDQVELEWYIDAAHPPTADQLAETVTDFQQLGVGVEVDLTVAINNLTGSQEQNLSTQADIYKMATTVAATHGVKGIIIWGLVDQASFPPGGQAVLFDNNFNPKPAYQGVIEGLEAAP